MKKCIFTFMVSLLSVAMFATKATFDFTAKDDLGKACDLSKIVVENVTQGWTETLTGPDFSLELEEGSQGLEDVSASNGALSVIGTDPFTGSTQLSLNVAQTGDVYVSLIDLSGRVIYSQTQMLNAGSYVMNVNLPMPQLYYLIAETKSGVYSAKLLNQGIADNAEISIYPGVAQRVAAKQYGNHGYKDGDKIRFVGYAVISGKEYTVTVTITITIGMHKTIEFVFDTTSGNIKEKHTQTGSMYVGITGFNKDIYHFTNNPNSRYDILDKSSLDRYTSFVQKLSMDVNTALYWAVEDNLNHLNYCRFPSDISNVSIVTFTDGLENASSPYDSKYFDESKDEENLTYLNNTIKSTKVNGVPLTAYTVGVKGNDVKNEEKFANTLKKLASSDNNSYNIDMGQLNQTFKAIADDLYKQNIKPQLTVAFPPRGRKYRLVFDNVGSEEDAAAKSELYVEGQLNKDITWSNMEYKNCSSESGTKVQGVSNANKQYEFTLENFVDKNGNKIELTYVDLWYYDSSVSKWEHEAEFKKKEDAKIQDIKKSAAVMLILDCSNSLEESNHFAELKKAAINFLNILASGNNSGNITPPSEDPEEKPESASTYYIKHSWGSGADEDWSWQPMTKDGTNYIYYGKWGGYGANINTKASDTGSKWFDAADMSGASSLSIGDGVKFTYNPTSATLSVDKTSNSSTTDRAKVRFQKQDAYANIYAMSIEEFVDQVWVGTFVEHDFGTSAETSSYYDIPAGKAYPMVNVGGEWYMALDEKQYHFGAGKKYTFSCGDDGTYYTYSITVDGTFNAPAKSQVVAQGRILKSELKKNAVLKK